MVISCDVLVIGGGAVGGAIAYGAARYGAKVVLVDGADTDLRASRANFGLVWVQSKGASFPEYQRWTRLSADLWAGFASELQQSTGLSLHHRQTGGLSFCLGDEEFDAKRQALQRMHNLFGAGDYACKLLSRAELADRIPKARLGPRVTGAAWSPHDGDVDPLMLMRALFEALSMLGVTLLNGRPVDHLKPEGDGFVAQMGERTVRAGKVVIAAGHGSTKLAAAVEIDAPLRAQRGQILVSERIASFLPLPSDTIRQTEEGTVLIGSSQENVGFDIGTTVSKTALMAQRAVAVFPDLASATFVRAWAGLRILTPDGAPIYAQSERYPGAFLAVCHSGVSLAAAHASIIAHGVVEGRLPEAVAAFGAARFEKVSHVQAP